MWKVWNKHKYYISNIRLGWKWQSNVSCEYLRYPEVVTLVSNCWSCMASSTCESSHVYPLISLGTCPCSNKINKHADDQFRMNNTNTRGDLNISQFASMTVFFKIVETHWNSRRMLKGINVINFSKNHQEPSRRLAKVARTFHDVLPRLAWKWHSWHSSNPVLQNISVSQKKERAKAKFGESQIVIEKCSKM